MAMQIYVLSDTRLKSISEWQNAIMREGFPLLLDDDDKRELSEITCFVPAMLEQKRTGFECYHITLKELADNCHGIRFDREWKYVLELVWGGDFAEMQAATMAAAAYARATGGIVFDAEAGQFLTAAEAFETVQEDSRILAELPELKAET
jgi:hypothetical protein